MKPIPIDEIEENDESNELNTVDLDAREAVESLDGYRDWVKEIRSEREGLNFGDW